MLASLLIDGWRGEKSCSADELALLLGGAAVPLPARIRQRAPAHQPVDGDGRGGAHPRRHGPGPYVTFVTPGRIVDAGITDANNMGAAMAPAACDTLTAHFRDTDRTPAYYDAVITGDLGLIGRDITRELMGMRGIDLGPAYTDCGVLIFDSAAQDTHAGGSGCGCSASVLAGHILRCLRRACGSGCSSPPWAR